MAKSVSSFRNKVIEGFLQLTSPVKAGVLSVYTALTTALFTQMASAYQTGGGGAGSRWA